MKFITSIIFLLLFGDSKCHFMILKEASYKSAKLGEAVKTLLSCYDKDVHTVGIAGISDRYLQKILSELSIPLISIGNDITKSHLDYRSKDRALRHRLNLYVVEASSSKQLHQILRSIKTSKWWNHLAPHVLIDRQSQSSERGCSNAAEYMRTAWIMNLLRILYVCIENPTKKVLLYTYNPYTNKAPGSWQLENTYPGTHGHPWTVFIRDYRPEKLEICKDLNFDKTRDLGGYDVKWGVPATSSSSPPPEAAEMRELFDVFRVEKYIGEAVNATARLMVFFITNPETQEVTIFQPGMKSYKSRAISPTDEFEISLFKGDHLANPPGNWSNTYPCIPGGIRIVTQYRGNMTQLAKIIGVLDKSTRLGLCLVVLLTVLFFRFFLRQPLGSAMLNVIRIITNSSLLRVPERTAPRLYLAGISILVVTIVGIYQGLIASLLTKPTPLKELETMQDLVDSTRTIYLAPSAVKYFEHPKFSGRIIVSMYANCVSDVIHDPLAVCIIDHLTAIESSLEQKIHASKKTIAMTYLTYVTKPDWPIEERINEVIAAFNEAHIYWYVHAREKELLLEKEESLAEWKKNRTDVVMTLSDLGFAFAILGIGLGLATVAFIVELMIKWVNSL